MIRETKESLPIFFTRMAPSHFFDVRNFDSKKPLEALCKTIVLCVSAIGSANAFVQGMKKVCTCFCSMYSFIFSPFIVVVVVVLFFVFVFPPSYLYSNSNHNLLQLGAVYVDQLEFSDHHMFKSMVLRCKILVLVLVLMLMLMRSQSLLRSRIWR